MDLCKVGGLIPTLAIAVSIGSPPGAQTCTLGEQFAANWSQVRLWVCALVCLSICGPTPLRSHPAFTPTQLCDGLTNTPSGPQVQDDCTALLISLLSCSTTAASSHLLLRSSSLREHWPPTRPCLRRTRASSPRSLPANHLLREQPRRAEASCCPPPLPASTARPTALSRSPRPTPAEPSAWSTRGMNVELGDYSSQM